MNYILICLATLTCFIFPFGKSEPAPSLTLHLKELTLVADDIVFDVSTTLNSQGYGCYIDKDSDQILKGFEKVSNDSNTKENCANVCIRRGYKFAGVKYGKQCFCGDKILLPKNQIPDSLCKDTKCSGNSEDFCGGKNKIWVYLTDGSGCYNIKDSEKVLTDAQHLNINNTKESCAYSCTLGGYKYAGVKNGKQCFCGNEIRIRKNKIQDELCNEIKCSGNSKDFCGGEQKIWVYSTDGLGCYSDSDSDRILTGTLFINSEKNTKANCANTCKHSGYKYAGVKYGNKCFCGNEIFLRKNKIQDELCSERKCSSDSNDFCGGPNTIWVYLTDVHGCYSDFNPHRILTGAEYLVNNYNTRESCAKKCLDGGYRYAGVEYEQECFCGNEILFRKNKIIDRLCNEKKCSGNSKDFCGGENKIWVYLSDGYGCYSNEDSDRVLADRKILTVKKNSIENCRDICKADGYKYSGVKNGNQCFCGHEILVRKNKIPDELCNELKCSGNSKEFCGGQNKIWIYSADH